MRPRRITVPTTTVDLPLDGRAGRIIRYAFAETTGAAPASFVLYDGQDDTGNPMLPINLVPSESTREWTGPNGDPYRGGLFLEMTSGSIVGSVVVISEDEWEEYLSLVRALGG